MFSEQIKLIGKEGQERLQKSSVLVVGAGGLGCSALTYLAKTGLKKIGVVDPDVVELSNLARQTLYDKSDIGKSKAKIAKQKLALESCYDELFTKDHLISYDIVLDCTDNAAARYAINDACQEEDRPWVYAAIMGWEGHVALFKGRNNYRKVFPEQPKTILTCSSGGVLGAFVGMIGACQALEAIKYLWGVTSYKFLTFNALDWSFKKFQMQEERAITINYDTYKQMKNTVLIDIREKEEREKGHLGGLHIPMNEVAHNLPQEGVIVLYCQRGIRSQKTASELRQKFPEREIYSLEGGYFNLKDKWQDNL